MKARSVLAVVVAAAATTLGITAVSVDPAVAHQASSGPPQSGGIVSAVPSTITPQIDNGSVRGIAQVGNTMVIGGNFTSIGGVSHQYLAAFNATTGAMSTTFNPVPNGMVNAVIPGPTANTVYVAGEFTTIAGASSQFIAELDATSGALIGTFKAPKFDYGEVNDLALSGGRLFIAGFFQHVGGFTHAGIAALNPTTGAVDPYMNVQFAGHHNQSGGGAQGYIGPWTFDIDPAGDRMIVGGDFKTADGLLRDQVAMIDLNAGSAAVDPNWATQRYSPLCFSWAFDGYIRGVNFSPDGSYVAVNATGGGNPGTLCDATARFETYANSTNLQPTWVDETGGDTVWATTITDDAVYIGGHNRWNNNPLGVDHAQPGAVPRPGLAALDPVSGRPYAWNPGHNPLGAAVYALLATPAGLWMGYDSNWIGNYQYKRMKIAFFPYTGDQLASTTTQTLPSRVFLGSATSFGHKMKGGANQSTSNVLYRVNAGGPSVRAVDGGPAWSADTNAHPSKYLAAGSRLATYPTIDKVASNVPSSTPRSIFDDERWTSGAMRWSFPAKAGTKVDVRLYLSNRFTGTTHVGDQAMDATLDGARVLSRYDVVADAGNQTGTMKSFAATVPADGRITLDLSHVKANATIDGIEIVTHSKAAGDAGPLVGDSLTSVAFNGTTNGTPTSVGNGGIPWSQTRGAFMVGNKVFYGQTDGYLHSATFDGTTFGTPVKIDPYHDPIWDGVDSNDGTTFDGMSPQFYGQLNNVTGMFYQAGRLYFTLNNDPNLHWAWFSPDSGIVDNTEFTASSSVNLSTADGMFASGNTLYVASKSDGGLYAMSFTGGAVTGSATLVNGPSTGGINWTSQALFLGPPAPNQPPVAQFISQCTNLSCTFDASGSNDPDGSIASYAWDFGDGQQGTGVNPTHSYTNGGQYTVTLTVTDNQGATGTVQNPVNPSRPAGQITFVGAGHSAPGASAFKTVTVPSGAQPGQTALLFLTAGTSANPSGPSGVTGWSPVDSFTNGTIATTVWQKTLAAGDPGASVRIDFGSSQKASLSLAVYAGVDPTTPVAQESHASDTATTQHTSAFINAGAGEWVVTYYSDKSSGTTTWTPAAGLTQRDAGYDSAGAGRFSDLIADSGGAVASGPYGGLTSTTNASSDRADMVTIGLNAAS